MKKPILLIVIIYTGLYCYSQAENKLKSIAYDLNNYEAFQAACEYTFSIPYGDTITWETIITTKKVPSDNLCGFYYNFQTVKSYKNTKFPDFTIYFDSIVYSSYLGKVKKTSYYESPSQFIEIKLENGIIPAVQKKTNFYHLTPYEIGKKIEEIIIDPSMIISQKPDTILELDTCLRYILESKSENNPFDRTNPDHWKEGKIIYELCFHHASLYPVLYKKEVYTNIVNQMEIAHFRNTKIDHTLPDNYFSKGSLLPENWDNPETPTTIEKKSPDELVGKEAPEWILPVLGSIETYSTDNLKGKAALLEFTATWCGHCFRAAEMMNRIETKFENNDNIEIISIYSSNLDTKESIERFVSRVKPKVTVLYEASAVEKKYNTQGYPNFFIISPKGKVIKYIGGYGETVEKDIIDALIKYTE